MRHRCSAGAPPHLTSPQVFLPGSADDSFSQLHGISVSLGELFPGLGDSPAAVVVVPPRPNSAGTVVSPLHPDAVPRGKSHPPAHIQRQLAAVDPSHTITPSEVEGGMTWAGLACIKCCEASDEAWKDVICTLCPLCTTRNGDFAYMGCLRCIVAKKVPGFWKGMTRQDVQDAPAFDHRSLF